MQSAGELRLANVREMPHPDVALERARLRYAQECLEGMRRKTASRVAAESAKLPARYWAAARSARRAGSG